MLGEDLKGFKPNMYRLMQRSQTPLKIALSYNHVFEQERNRVEFITDWPQGNEANIISSLQVYTTAKYSVHNEVTLIRPPSGPM